MVQKGIVGVQHVGVVWGRYLLVLIATPSLIVVVGEQYHLCLF